MASLSTCQLGLWLGWQILLNLIKYDVTILPVYGASCYSRQRLGNFIYLPNYNTEYQWYGIFNNEFNTNNEFNVYRDRNNAYVILFTKSDFNRKL